MLNIDAKGAITENGQPFAYVAQVMPKLKYSTKPQGANAQIIPEQFTFDTGAGIELYPAGSYLVECPTDTFQVLTPAQFQAEFQAAQ